MVKPLKLIMSSTLRNTAIRDLCIRIGQINSTADPVAHVRQTAMALRAIARAHGFEIQHRDLHQMTIRALYMALCVGSEECEFGHQRR